MRRDVKSYSTNHNAGRHACHHSLNPATLPTQNKNPSFTAKDGETQESHPHSPRSKFPRGLKFDKGYRAAGLTKGERGQGQRGSQRLSTRRITSRAGWGVGPQEYPREEYCHTSPLNTFLWGADSNLGMGSGVFYLPPLLVSCGVSFLMSQASGQSGCLSSIQIKEGLLFKASRTLPVLWYTPILSAFGKKVNKTKFKASLCCTVKPCLDKQAQAKLAIWVF